MRIILQLLSAIVVLLVVGVGGILLWSREPEIAAIDPLARSAFPRDLIEAGERLAAIGNCDVCHTTQGGPVFAGGRPIPTPFGTIYSTNITPDPKTGIGQWSEAAFDRAMRDGIARDGHRLYPAFPYDHFTRLTDDDLHALYAFVMTRELVSRRAPANDLPFPLNWRWTLAVWNALYAQAEPYRSDTRHSAEWNRGAYLVTGLGHCGDCHTPRNWLGAEKTDAALSGGEAEGWTAPALNAASPAPIPWDAAHLADYLRHGRSDEHGAAAGPMQPIVDDLARADPNDVEAIAAYLADSAGKPPPERQAQTKALLAKVSGDTSPASPNPGEETGAAIFAGACADCHLGNTTIAPPRGIDLSLSSALSEDDPRDPIRTILDGIRQPGEEAGPWMPPFAGSFTDAQLAALLRYLRAHYGRGSAWPRLESQIHDIRQSEGRR